MGCRHLRLAPDRVCAGGSIGTIGAIGPTPAWARSDAPYGPYGRWNRAGTRVSVAAG
jgi:hypothetical protein